MRCSASVYSTRGRALLFLMLFLPKPGVGDEAFQAVLRTLSRAGSSSAPISSRRTLVPARRLGHLTLPPSDRSFPIPSLIIRRSATSISGPGSTGLFGARSIEPRWSNSTEVFRAMKKQNAPRRLPWRFVAASKFGPTESRPAISTSLIRYSGPPGTFPAIPIFQLLCPITGRETSATAQSFATSVVLVGLYRKLVAR